MSGFNCCLEFGQILRNPETSFLEKQALDASNMFNISHGVKRHCMPLTMQFHFQTKVKICPYFFQEWFHLSFIALIMVVMKKCFSAWPAVESLFG